MSFLVLIHGRDSSKESFASVVNAVATRLPRLTVAAIDLPGHGTDVLSADAASAIYATEELLVQAIDERIQAALPELAASDRLILLGHSMGARAAVTFAKMRPLRVSALIVEDMDMRARAPMKWTRDEIASFAGQFFRSWAELSRELQRFGFDDAWLERKRGGLIQSVETSDVARLPVPFLRAAGDNAGAATATAAGGSVFFVGTNPHVTALAHDRLLLTDDHDALEALVTGGVALHVILASRGSACAASERDYFQRIAKSVNVVPNSNHSVHAAALVEFLDALYSVLAGLVAVSQSGEAGV
jgi:pimeloyl-ACP methyl ester carboxylesterase